MSLQLWYREGEHYFVENFWGTAVQVGQVNQNPYGSWSVEVNNNILTASDLEAAKRLFIEEYDRSLVQLSPLSLDVDEDDEAMARSDFSVIELTSRDAP